MSKVKKMYLMLCVDVRHDESEGEFGELVDGYYQEAVRSSIESHTDDAVVDDYKLILNYNVVSIVMPGEYSE